MKRFDTEASKNRMMQRLQIMEDWANIMGVGTIGNILDVIADETSEVARYLEYLYNEKKFRNARNLTSITHMTDLIAYKRSLAKSAVGYVIVSHNDEEGISRLQNFGSTFFDLDQASDYDEITKNKSGTFIEKSALVPWTSERQYIIPEGTVFRTNNGTTFISTEPVESRSLKEPFSAIKTNPTKYENFIQSGGWNGIKYLKVPVIQGEKQTIELGRAESKRFEAFTIKDLTVENASNVISEKYFKVKVTPQKKVNGLVTEEDVQTWEKIENIRLAGPYDRVFEIKILNDGSGLLIKFGDGITGEMLPKEAKISVEYLSTKGLAGNVEERFQVTQMIFPNNYIQVDPRTNEQKPFLTCTNIVPIMGGKNIEDEKSVKTYAPPSYLRSYSTATKATYYEQILKNSPVNLLHCRVFPSKIIDVESYGDTNSNSQSTSSIDELNGGILQEIVTSKNSLIVTAIRSNGTKLDDPESELIDPLLKSLDDKKSPNDSLDFIQPNFIEIRPNIIINSSDSITENDIKNEMMPEVLSRYSIFNTNFEVPYFKTVLTDIVHNYSYTDYATIFLEAKTTADLRPTILTKTKQEGIEWLDKVGYHANMGLFDDKEEEDESLFAFDFSFDKIFAQNRLNAGFKNFREKAPYLIRADIKFIKDSTKNKSLFLIDKRINLQDEVSLSEAESLAINSNQGVPSFKEHVYGNFSTMFGQNESESFYNQQVRTAQFSFIDRITTPSYFYQMLQFNIEPYEIRPLYVDENGKNKLFTMSEVPVSDRVSLLLNNNYTGTQCYRKNWNYFNHCKILFNENYNNPDDQNYAKGQIILPIKRVLEASDIITLKTMLENTNAFEDQTLVLENYLKSILEINVYAMPVADEFECENEFDIIFSNKDNILIQKNYLASTN